MKLFKYICFFSILFSLCTFCSCKAKDTDFRQKNYKRDMGYFLGLQHLRNGNIKEAERFFSICVKKGTKYCVRKSNEELVKIGNIRERTEKALNYYGKYNDENALIFAVNILKDAEETNKIITLTNNIDLKTCSNYLAVQRLDALEAKNDSRFNKTLEEWFFTRNFSKEHYSYYQRSKNLENTLIDFRVAVYRREYQAALAKYKEYCEKEGSFPLKSYLFSDLGKVFLYSGQDFYSGARKFDDLADQLTGRPEKFYAYFYAARLYEKAGNYYSLATKRFQLAMECANIFDDNEKYDNALWYLLNLSLKKSIQSGIDSLKKYCSTWHNPEYFDDLFSTLAPILLSEQKWNDIYDIYKAIDGFATDETVAKYAYISARLFQEGLLIPVIGSNKGSEADAAFTRALTSGTDVYYRAMALYKLGLGGNREEEIMCNCSVDSGIETDRDAEILLEGYAAFGFPERIYPEFVLLTKKGIKIGTDSAIKLSSFLKNCGENKNEYYPQALRIMSYVVSNATRPLGKEDFKLFFPRNYSSIVSRYCNEYNLPEDAMYALIRSESFFDKDIESFAGAVGLTQLMTATANDVAKKLKITDFDLRNAETNIQFGSFYLAELNRRLDGDWLPTFFAYNSGISRVRRWKKDSSISFPTKEATPNDILLEIIPYEETRGYGRKLIGAASMYSWLYYDSSIIETVERLTK